MRLKTTSIMGVMLVVKGPDRRRRADRMGRKCTVAPMREVGDVRDVVGVQAMLPVIGAVRMGSGDQSVFFKRAKCITGVGAFATH